MSDYARQVIQRLLNGHSPSDIDITRCGQWGETVQILSDAYHAGGTPQVRHTFDVMCRAHRELAILIASDRRPTSDTVCPPLSGITPGHTAIPWLDTYIAHSRMWSPRAFDDYHENVGLWVLAAVAARRIYAVLGKPRYTSLYIALVSRSGLFAKSTTAEIGMDVLRQANLDFMVTSDSVTPQKFIHDRTIRLPDNYHTMPTRTQQRVQQVLAFTGQRSWWYDEFGMLIQSMAKPNGIMQEFSGLLRRFDEHDDRYRHATIGRGSDEIHQPYVSILAAMTPADLRIAMKRGAVGWTNGLWPRWSFACPPEHTFKNDRFPRGERKIPHTLVCQLQEWHHELGIPRVNIMNDTVDIEPISPRAITVTPAVVDAYYEYSGELLRLIAEHQLDDLDSWYVRLHDRVFRVAILLAGISGSDRVELTHWQRAQEIGERWRSSIHRLHQQVNDSHEPTHQANAEDTVLHVIQRMGQATVRDIKTRVKWLSRTEIEDICQKLVNTGHLIGVATSRSIRYSVIEPMDETTE